MWKDSKKTKISEERLQINKTVFTSQWVFLEKFQFTKSELVNKKNALHWANTWNDKNVPMPVYHSR